jgi:hypothetical protein
LSLRSDDLNSVGELYSKDDFRQLVIAIETTPAFFGGLSELEDHRQRGLVRETSLGSHGPVAHRRERGFGLLTRADLPPLRARTGPIWPVKLGQMPSPVLSKGSLKAPRVVSLSRAVWRAQCGDRLTGPRALVVSLRVPRGSGALVATRLGSLAASCHIVPKDSG